MLNYPGDGREVRLLVRLARLELLISHPIRRFKGFNMGKTSSALSFRRSGRVNIGCPVRISGVLSNDRTFEENARIVTLSKFGAKMRTRLPLKVGMQIKVQPLLGEKSGIFKVVWVGREGSPRAGEVGVEHSGETSDILGINFPDANTPAR